jgi:hypothetical protein
MRRPQSPEELAVFYQAIGQGIWFLQFLEDALNKYLTLTLDVKTPGALPEGAAFDALKKRSKGTLGQSLKAGRDAGLLNETLESRLTLFVEERNWLVHKSLDTSGDSLYTEDGQRAFLERVVGFIEEAKQLQILVGHEIATFAKSHGVNLAEVERRAREHVAKLRGEA